MQGLRSGLAWEEAQVSGGRVPCTPRTDHLLSSERLWTELNLLDILLLRVKKFTPRCTFFLKEILYLQKCYRLLCNTDIKKVLAF